MLSSTVLCSERSSTWAESDTMHLHGYPCQGVGCVGRVRNSPQWLLKMCICMTSIQLYYTLSYLSVLAVNVVCLNVRLALRMALDFWLLTKLFHVELILLIKPAELIYPFLNSLEFIGIRCAPYISVVCVGSHLPTLTTLTIFGFWCYMRTRLVICQGWDWLQLSHDLLWICSIDNGWMPAKCYHCIVGVIWFMIL